MNQNHASHLIRLADTSSQPCRTVAISRNLQLFRWSEFLIQRIRFIKMYLSSAYRKDVLWQKTSLDKVEGWLLVWASNHVIYLSQFHWMWFKSLSYLTLLTYSAYVLLISVSWIHTDGHKFLGTCFDGDIRGTCVGRQQERGRETKKEDHGWLVMGQIKYIGM